MTNIVQCAIDSILVGQESNGRTYQLGNRLFAFIDLDKDIDTQIKDELKFELNQQRKYRPNTNWLDCYAVGGYKIMNDKIVLMTV